MVQCILSSMVCNSEDDDDVSDYDSAVGETARLETYIASVLVSPCTSSSDPSRKQRRKGSTTSFNE